MNPQQPSLFAEPEESPVPASATPSPASVAPESPAPVAPSEPDAGFEDDVLPELAPGLEGYLEQIALLAAQDQAKDEDVREKVSLMTVHTAKGLEFDAVFVIGLEEGLFPNGRALDESVEGLEEERRLAYVALTRARKRLFLSHASARSRFGRTDYRPPSPFLFELPEQAFEAGKAPRDLTPHGVPASTLRWDPDDDGLDDQGYPVEEGAARRPGRRTRPDGAAWDDADPEGPDPTAPADGERARPVEVEAADLPEFDSSPLWSRRVSGAREPARGAGRAASSAQRSPEAAPPRPAPVQSPAGALDLEAGDRVRHEHFGLGEVVTVAGSGIAKRARIRFLEFGEKNLVVQYARLVKVPR